MNDDQPHYHGHRQRLRDRFLKSGLDGFTDYEVVELLLTLALPRSDAKQPAKAREFTVTAPPEVAICKECDLKMLCHAEGILRREEALA